MTVAKIGVLIGSLRKESYSRKIYMVLKSMVPDGFEMEEIKIGDLSIYNQDFDDEGNPPMAWTQFRKDVKGFDAFLFITPEYNRSVPAVIKNAIDVGSRPYGESVWDGKPGAVVSVSPGRLSAFGANHHLRQSLVFLNIPVMQQPEAYIGEVASIFDDNGVITDERTQKFLQTFANSFADWINLITANK